MKRFILVVDDNDSDDELFSNLPIKSKELQQNDTKAPEPIKKLDISESIEKIQKSVPS